MIVPFVVLIASGERVLFQLQSADRWFKKKAPPTWAGLHERAHLERCCSAVSDASAPSIGVRIVIGNKELFVEGRTFVVPLFWPRRHFDGFRRHVFVGNLAEQMTEAVQPGPALVIGLNGEPGRLRNLGFGEHDVFRFGVLHPAVARLNIHGTELPAPFLVVDSLLEAFLLFFVGDGELVLQKQNSIFGEQ